MTAFVADRTIRVSKTTKKSVVKKISYATIAILEGILFLLTVCFSIHVFNIVAISEGGDIILIVISAVWLTLFLWDIWNYNYTIWNYNYTKREEREKRGKQ
jgi:ACR3 family arsenite efflux pump ArsB